MCNWILDLVGLALLLLVVFLYACKPRNQIHMHRLLPLLILFAFLSTASDLFYALWENHLLWFHAHVPLWVNIANNYLYFLFHLPSIAIYSLYLLELNHARDAEDPVPKLFWAPLAVLGSFLLLNPLTSWFFHVDADGMYHSGPLRYLWYVGVAGYVIHGYYLLLKEQDAHMRKPLVAQTFFLTLAVIGTLIQFFHPSFLVENYTIDLSIFVSFVSLSRLEDVTEWNTGLFNRDIFTLWCERDFKHHTPFTLVLVHMKDWKLLNESLGDHAFHCLEKEIATYLTSFSRWVYTVRDDVYALWFADHATMVQSEVVRTLNERSKQPWSIDGEQIGLRLQMLVADSPRDFRSLAQLQDILIALGLQHASKTVMNLKLDLQLEEARKQKLLDILSRKCSEENGLEVVYQPVWDVKARRFISAEALVRLTDPVLGKVRPDELIAVAERNGSIVRIDACVRKIVQQLLLSNDLSGFPIHVNLSMAECMQEQVVRDIIRSTSSLGIRRERFGLELTETASAYLPAVAKSNLLKLASAGFRLYLDDFGQGQANLDHLIMLPFSVVKLDRSFVTNPMGEKLRANTISLVKRLGMKALIEGVETKEEAEAVIADGVDYIQGFYYSKPLSKDQFLAFLRAHTFD